MKMRCWVALFALLSMSVGAVDEAPDAVVDVLDFGVYTASSGTSVLLTRTQRIEAAVGTTFGIRVRASRDAEIAFRWQFPEMQQPGTGRVFTEMTGTRRVVGGEVESFLARFNQAWETVPGAWTLQLFVDDGLVLEHVFQVEKGPGDRQAAQPPINA